MKRPATIAEVPGYLAALEDDSVRRDTAFLCERARIGRFVVRPLTLRMFAELRVAGSPFLPPFPTPDRAELIAFLWRVSPQFQRHNPRAQARFARQFRFLQPQPRPWLRLPGTLRRWEAHNLRATEQFARYIHLTREYVKHALADKPASGGAASGPGPVSDLCSILGTLGSRYHHFGSEAEILDLPLAKIFQYLRDSRIHDYTANVRAGLRAEPPVFLGQADRLVADYMAKMNQPAAAN